MEQELEIVAEFEEQREQLVVDCDRVAWPYEILDGGTLIKVIIPEGYIWVETDDGLPEIWSVAEGIPVAFYSFDTKDLYFFD